jgi:hypothetical protein
VDSVVCSMSRLEEKIGLTKLLLVTIKTLYLWTLPTDPYIKSCRLCIVVIELVSII